MNKIVKLIGRTPIKSFGSSMEPLLYSNDIVYFKKINAKQIKVNDIVLINKQQSFIHRVIYKNNQYLVTKGDNNYLSDGKIKPNQVLGQVVKIKRGKNVYKPADIYLIQSSLYLKEIIKIKKLLEKNKIEYVFLKGLPLHLFFESSNPKRLFFDCDILINREHFQKAEKIILSQGYKNSNSSKSSSPELSYQKMIKEFPVNLDVHLEAVFMMTKLGHLEALYPQSLIDRFTHELLNTKREIIINNESFFILNTHYLILYLALHIFHHNFEGAHRFQFLDMVIKKNKFDSVSINRLIYAIKIYKFKNFVTPVFILLKKYYNTPLPRSLIPAMSQWNNVTDIFNSETRIIAGINRFKNLFFLSPYPLWKRLFVFTNYEVIHYVFFVLKKKLFYFLKEFLKNH